MIDLYLYISDHCPFSSISVEKVNRLIDPFSDLINLQIIKVESEPAKQNNNIKVVPTIKIGKHKIEGNFDESELFQAIISSFQYDDILNSREMDLDKTVTLCCINEQICAHNSLQRLKKKLN